MRFTKDKFQRINKNIFLKTGHKEVFIDSSPGGFKVFINKMGCCKVEELNRIIEELNELKSIIEEETGIIL